MSKPRVLIFSDCYIFGGSEKLISYLLKNETLNKNFNLLFSYRKHDDYIKGLRNECLLDREENFPLYLFSNRSLFYKIDCFNLNKYFKYFLKFPFFLLDILKIYTVLNILIFVRLLISVKPDIIHINNGGYPGAETCSNLFLANFLVTRAKTIYQINNLADNRSNVIQKIFDNFLNNHANCFLTASFKAKNELVSRRGFSPEKFYVVNNCVPLSKITFDKNEIRSQLNIPSNGFFVVCVAFLNKRKGQIYLIEAINKLLRDNFVQRDTFFCALIGSGEDYELLNSRINELGLLNNIFLLGYKNNSDDYINASDLFILPSISNEDMPLVILSALGHGKPIISTDFAGISQVINSGHNGLLVDIQLDSLTINLVSALKTLYNDIELRTKLGQNAKETYSEYSPIVYGENLKNIYNHFYAK